ncbi:hypothetical protein NTH44_003110 [Vibrio metoecus]
MNIKVQSITLNETRTEKSVLAAMRKAMPSEFEYLVRNNSQLTRFSSDSAGPIKPMVAFDKLIQQNVEVNDSELILILSYSSDLCMLVTIRKGQVTAIEIILKDAIDLEIYSKLKVIVEDGLQHLAENRSLTILDTITQYDLERSDHQFLKQRPVSQLSKKAYFGAALILISIVSIVFFSSSDDELNDLEEKPKVIEVKTVRTVKMDTYHSYKSFLDGKVQYPEISKALMVATLLRFKLPDGWEIEEIKADNKIVSANIININGRTSTLKYLRDNSGYAQFIDIDGQSANFSYPVVPNSWWDWTGKTDSFQNVRDDFMDQMILLGGTLRSIEPIYNNNHTTQEWEVNFEEVSIAYLDLLNSLLEKKPIFINKFEVRPMASQEAERINIKFTASIVGR